jgi:hypothetical protein
VTYEVDFEIFQESDGFVMSQIRSAHSDLVTFARISDRRIIELSIVDKCSPDRGDCHVDQNPNTSQIQHLEWVVMEHTLAKLMSGIHDR